MEMLRIPSGSVVMYNNAYALLWNINASNKVQLISPDGDKLIGTPSIDKIRVIKELPRVVYNKTTYVVDKHNRIFSLSTGKLCFITDCPQRTFILNTKK